MMHFDLKQDALSHTLITAHRGCAGGNIPCNSYAAFEAALMQGADMIELDVAHSADGELFIFHPGMEKAHLNIDRRLCDMPAQEIRSLHYVNGDRVLTPSTVMTFDEAMEQLKGRCYINIDKFWENVDPLTQAIRRHGMEQQVLVKTGPNRAIIDYMENCAPEINYMLILSEKDEWSEALLGRNLKYVGVEALFTRDDSPIACAEYLQWMHAHQLLVWANAIVYNSKDVLTAGHNDDVSVSGNPDDGWGWLLNRGFNIIQTDWPLMLRNYAQIK